MRTLLLPGRAYSRARQSFAHGKQHARTVRRGLAASQPASDDASLAGLLKGTSVVVVGDSDALNEAVAQHLAQRLGYAPLCLRLLLERLSGQTWSALQEEEGAQDSLAVAEAQVLEELSTQGRTCVATVGGGCGAAARGACWRFLHGAITVWLDSGMAQPDQPEPQRDAYGLAEVQLAVEQGAVLSADFIASEAVRALHLLLQREPALPGKKQLYIKLGGRGDWVRHCFAGRKHMRLTPGWHTPPAA